MTEITEPPYEAPEAPTEDGGTFLAVAELLQEESRRLAAIADDCRSLAGGLAEREAAVTEREQVLADAQRELERRHDELNRWQHDLNDRAARVEEARGRIAEASEREAALKAMAESLLERYNDAHSSS